MDQTRKVSFSFYQGFIVSAFWFCQLHEGEDRNLSSQMDIVDVYADLFHLNYPNIF